MQSSSSLLFPITKTRGTEFLNTKRQTVSPQSVGHQHAGYSNHKIHGLNGSTQLTKPFRFGGLECTGLEEKSEAWVDCLIQKESIPGDFDDFDDFCMLLSAFPVPQVCQQAVCPVDCSLSEWQRVFIKFG